MNVFTPAQFGAFIPWLMMNRGPLSCLVHPNTGEENELYDHVVGAAWIGEKGDIRSINSRTTRFIEVRLSLAYLFVLAEPLRQFGRQEQVLIKPSIRGVRSDGCWRELMDGLLSFDKGNALGYFRNIHVKLNTYSVMSCKGVEKYEFFAKIHVHIVVPFSFRKPGLFLINTMG